MREEFLNLQLFAEDAGAAGGTATAGSPLATGTAGNPPATGTADTPPATETAGGQEPVQEESFDNLIKTKYKKEYDAHIQNAVKRRVKDFKQMEDRVNAVQPVMDLFGRRYGIDTSNMTQEAYSQLVGKILEDNSFYEDEALKMGLDVETYKNLQRTERENTQLKRMVADGKNRELMNRRFEKLNQEAMQLQQLYPGFDLNAEMENPEFHRLTWEAGVPLRTAYEVIHHNEILPAAMQYTAQRTAEKLSNSIQSGMGRPQENGLSQQSASLSGNPTHLSKQEREDIKNRVRAGEKVIL